MCKEYHKIQSIYKRDEATHKFMVGQFSLPEFEYLYNNLWDVEEKIDGCLHYHNPIITDKGIFPIGKIVEKKMDVKVLSYNTETKIGEFKEIEHYHKEKRNRPFLAIKFIGKARFGSPKFVVCTDNHMFFSNGEWVEAKNLVIGQKVSHLIEQIPYEIKQIILGGLLGDSCITRGSASKGFSFLHSIKQSDYFEFKKFLLGKIFNECKGTIGGFEGSLPNRRGHSIMNRTMSNFITDYCEYEGKKTITEKWTDEIDPLGIAIWYMDDGSTSFNDKQRPRARFATNSFTLKEVELLKNMFLKKYNIESDIFDYKGNTLCLTADSTEKLFCLIFPYVCDSMKYKLPEKYKEYPCVLTKSFDTFSSLVDTNVIEINANMPVAYKKQQTYQYDLTIKDNSNYFVRGVLVHNTNIRLMYDGKELKLGGKTDNAQIPSSLVNKFNDTFSLDLIKDTFNTNENEESNVCLYMEGYGLKIQKAGSSYIPDGVDFILFDIRIGHWWLKRDDVSKIAEKLNIKCVPNLGILTLKQAEYLTREGFKSKIGTCQAEGVVCRPYIDLLSRNGSRVITKIKTTDF